MWSNGILFSSQNKLHLKPPHQRTFPFLTFQVYIPCHIDHKKNKGEYIYICDILSASFSFLLFYCHSFYPDTMEPTTVSIEFRNEYENTRLDNKRFDGVSIVQPTEDMYQFGEQLDFNGGFTEVMSPATITTGACTPQHLDFHDGFRSASSTSLFNNNTSSSSLFNSRRILLNTNSNSNNNKNNNNKELPVRQDVLLEREFFLNPPPPPSPPHNFHQQIPAFDILAEAAKRAEMSLLIRDLENL